MDSIHRLKNLNNLEQHGKEERRKEVLNSFHFCGHT